MPLRPTVTLTWALALRTSQLSRDDDSPELHATTTPNELSGLAAARLEPTRLWRSEAA
ncbi:MAG: hypothetical protein ACT4P7_06995 [Gemmatimonadaceae bacterium]